MNNLGMDRLATVIMSTSSRLSKILRNTRYVTSLIVVVCFSVNLIVVFNNAEPVPPHLNVSRTYTCYEPKEFFVIWDVVHIVMYSLLPFTIILAENATLMCLAKKHAKRMRNMSYNSTMSSYPRTANLQMTQKTTATILNNIDTDDYAKTSFINR